MNSNVVPPLPSDVLPPTRTANISPSSIACYRRCPREFMWRNRCGLSKSGVFAAALETGTLYHEARALYRLAAHPETVAERLAAMTEKMGVEFVQAADPNTELLPDGKALEDILTQIDEAEATAIMLAEAANTFLPWPPNKDDWKIVAREKTYERHQATWNVLRKGRIDALALNLTTMEYWIVDDKTTSEDPALLAKLFRFDPQFQMYLDLITQVEDFKPAGVILDIMKKPTIRLKKDESRLEYIDRCREWYRKADHVDCTIRTWIRATEDPLSLAEYHGLLESMNSPASLPVYPHQFPRNTAACTKWGRECIFLPLCSADPIMWKSLVDSMFSTYTGKGH